VNVVRAVVRCPVCRCPTPWGGNRYRPFCSERCKLHDLGNWASDRYRLPGAPVTADEADVDAEDGDDLPPRGVR